MRKKIEILAPVGDFSCLRAAIKAKADSIYFGVDNLNMRSRSTHNFKIENLEEVVKLCREHEIKSYLTLNTIIYDEELQRVKQICQEAQRVKIDAIIAADLAVIQYAHSMGINLHISTQANVCNIETIRFFSQYATAIVLSRELTLEQIVSICRTIEKEQICGPDRELMKVELFIHGALCVALSGKCYMSLAQYNKSANRGECFQVCRRRYRVIEEETQKELMIDNHYIMSPRDLCTLPVLDRIVKSGVTILKIEGRARPAEYVDIVVRMYRKAIRAIETKAYTKENIDCWMQELASVFNRGFWNGGYYLGEDIGQWSEAYGSQHTRKKIYVGKATHYFSKIGVAEILIQAYRLCIGDEILVIGDKTGVVRSTIANLRSDVEMTRAKPGDCVSFPLCEKIRKNDKLYVLEERM